MNIREISEKIRKSYLDIHYDTVHPLNENLVPIGAFVTEQTKLFEGLIKKFEAVSKKMDEAEAKLKLLEEVSKKMAVNGSKEVTDLANDTKAELNKVEKQNNARKLARIDLQGIDFKVIEQGFKELTQAVGKLKIDTETNVKTSDDWVKIALKLTVEGAAVAAKQQMDDAKILIGKEVAKLKEDTAKKEEEKKATVYAKVEMPATKS